MNLWLIPVLPLAGAAINGIFGRRFSRQVVNLIAIGSVMLSFLWVIRILVGWWPLEQPHVERYFTWIQSGT